MEAISTVSQNVGNTVTYSPVLQDHHSKTLDIGLNGATLSAGPLGDILQLSCFHPVHGFVVVSPFAQFDGGRFYDPGYVRKYRATMLEHIRSGIHGFGVQFEGTPKNLGINFVDNQWILITYTINEFQLSTTLSINQSGEVAQSTRIRSKATSETGLAYTFALDISVNRASYGQLTEGGPLPIPPSKNALRLFDQGRRWAVINPNLDAAVEGSLSCNGHPMPLESEIYESVAIGEPIHARFRGTVQLPPNESCIFVSKFHLRPGPLPFNNPTMISSLGSGFRGQWRLENDQRGLIIRRNLEYILGNCTIPVRNGFTCFITDHVALPLGWNRDNYWQIRFLLDVYRNLDRIAYPETARTYASIIRTSVQGHLNWVFRLAQRPHGYWRRSYLSTGVPKDGPVFQQDQQCYPLLELCDFFEAFPSESLFVRELISENTIPNILNMLQARQDPQTGLYPTEETPGDDAVEYPFHFSSHVLLWHTITRLSHLAKTFPVNPQLNHSQLEVLASKIRKSTLYFFTAENPKTSTTMFAYLTSGAGQHTFYHDANDIPTLFIPAWGFASSPADEALWLRTMDFGLSALNEGGFYPSGPFGGLGSVHTQGPWPLGYVQEYAYASIQRHEAAKEDAWRRIKGCMFWDGLFPEAVDGTTGDCVSKAWFSWPGAMIGSALLKYALPELVVVGERAMI